MIMLQAIACNHGVEPVRNGTALTITKATLRAQVYSAMVRTSFVVLKTAAIENPRLITALAAVISAHKRNGMFIQDAYRAGAHFWAAAQSSTAAADWSITTKSACVLQVLRTKILR